MYLKNWIFIGVPWALVVTFLFMRDDVGWSVWGGIVRAIYGAAGYAVTAGGP